MSKSDPDRVVSDFLAGRMSRREMVIHLMALGAACAGIDRATLAAADDSAQAEPGSTFAARSIDHIALNVTDVARSREWYMKHLGLRPMSDSRTTSFLRIGESGEFVALFTNEKPGMHHFSLGIDEYDQQRAEARLRDAGLTPKLRGRRIYFDDPDGIEVQVSQQPRPAAEPEAEGN